MLMAIAVIDELKTMEDQTGIDNDAFEETENDKSDESWIGDNEENPKKNEIRKSVVNLIIKGT